MKRKKQDKLTKYQIENYSVAKLEKYLLNRNRVNIKAIKRRIKELKKENEDFINSLVESDLYRLACKLLIGQPRLDNVFDKKRRKRVLKYLKIKSKRPYKKINKQDYMMLDPYLILETMLYMVDVAHDKEIKI